MFSTSGMFCHSACEKCLTIQTDNYPCQQLKGSYKEKCGQTKRRKEIILKMAKKPKQNSASNELQGGKKKTFEFNGQSLTLLPNIISAGILILKCYYVT